jgi:hypothetical protein
LAQQQPQANLTSSEQQLLTEGNSFEIDNVTFSHHTASVNGINLHYVMGEKEILSFYYMDGHKHGIHGAT